MSGLNGYLSASTSEQHKFKRLLGQLSDTVGAPCDGDQGLCLLCCWDFLHLELYLPACAVEQCQMMCNIYNIPRFFQDRFFFFLRTVFLFNSVCTVCINIFCAI